METRENARHRVLLFVGPWDRKMRSRAPIALIVGVVAAVLALAGCSKTSSGTPSQQQVGSASSSSAGDPTDPAPSAPSSLPTSVPSVGSGKYAGSKMCQDFRDAGGRVGDVQSGDKYGVRLWRKLAADAPPPIKPNARLVAKFVADAAAGHPDVTGVSKAMTALGKVSDWATKNCI
jgi:nucleoside-diphosphate-sugar epimerase